MTLELTTAAIFLLSTFYGTPIAAEKLATLDSGMSQIILADKPITLEQYVREYFTDTPILAEIAKCESRFRHIGRNGKVLRGETVVEDVGVMQINEFYHEDTAKALGLDLHTLDGNLAYAKWLYAKEGITPWYSSAKCWQKSNTLAKTGFAEQNLVGKAVARIN